MSPGSKIRLIACKARLSIFSGCKSPVLRILCGSCKFSLLSKIDRYKIVLNGRVQVINLKFVTNSEISVNDKIWQNFLIGKISLLFDI